MEEHCLCYKVCLLTVPPHGKPTHTVYIIQENGILLGQYFSIDTLTTVIHGQWRFFEKVANN